MDEHRNEPIGEQQTGPAAAAEGAQSAGVSNESSATTPAPAAGTQAAKLEAPKSDAVQSQAGASGGSRARPGTVTIMAPPRHEDWYRHWDDEIEVEAPDEASQSAAQRFGLRKLAAVAAAVILAAIAGAVGGALATAGLSHRGDTETTAASVQVKTLDTQVAQLKSELTALKADLDHATKQSSAQLGKTADRVEKLEKAQAEPVAKLAKLTEMVDKMRTAQAQSAAPVNVASVAAKDANAKDVTGSIAPKPEPAKSQPGRLPTIEGWVLRDVYDGGAVIEGRSGTYEVYAGDPVPGLGRVDAIRRQDGRWVVVTNRGLIVSR